MEKQRRVPLADLWDWQSRAACRGMGSSVFYTPHGERGPQRRARESKARELCASCPVREQCAQFALSTQEPYGVWGGLTEADRGPMEFRKGVVIRAERPAAAKERDGARASLQTESRV